MAGVGDLVGGFSGVLGTLLGLIPLLFAGFIIIAVLLVFYAWHEKKWIFTPYPLIIENWVPRGNDVELESTTRGRVVKDAVHGDWIENKGWAGRHPVYESKYFDSHGKISILHINRDESRPMILLHSEKSAVWDKEKMDWLEINNGYYFKPIMDEDVKAVYANSYDENVKRFTIASWMKDIFPFLMMVLSFIAFGLFLFFILSAFQPLAASTSGAAASNQQASNALIAFLNHSGCTYNAVSNYTVGGLAPP